MAAIKDLLRQITDQALRERLTAEIDRSSRNKKFGLVFEEHIPECTPLHGVPVRPGSTVVRKSGRMNDLYAVKKIDGDAAVCVAQVTQSEETIPLRELVPAARFGEPIFPSLEPIAKVTNAPEDPLWHTIIEADNYHALQLLQYLYEGKVDCIYIDPPYNTGARDWKYNNDYVDANDAWRHSKWLSMMQKRLLLAKRVLNPDTGVMIVAIDDYEMGHLIILLEQIFPEYECAVVVVNHHPQGGAADNVSRTHEYALFVIPNGKKILCGNQQVGFDEIWSLMRGGRDVRNLRIGRPNSFYAIYVDKKTFKIKGVGERLPVDATYSLDDTPEGYKAIYPIGRDGRERVWRYERATMSDLISKGEIISSSNFALKVIKRRDVKYSSVFSLWADARYNAGRNGTDILSMLIGSDNGFAYPKSLYTVLDAIRFSTQEIPDALIVDFFAGSGTTLHAVNLLNAEDGGKRRCILVTNNEVSEDEARDLKATGRQPGDPEWEERGICRSVTWPRTAYSILGKRADGTVLSGEYHTNQTITKEVSRSFYQLGFVEHPATLSLSAKKQIVALLGRDKKDRLPQSLVKANSRFIVSEKHTAAVLFDTEAADEWLAALEEQEHITDFYIVAKENRVYNDIRERVAELLGPISVAEAVKRPMSEGFPANVEYFKLGFLERNSVSLGRQFHAILPLLWLKAGAIGERPELEGEELPDMLILPRNAFAVLLDENRYSTFAKALLETEHIRTAYFVTDSEEAFREMSDGIGIERAWQLYRDYLDNFVIGGGRNHS